MIATSVKQFAGELADTRAFDFVLRRFENRGSSKRFLRVLTWHRVGNPADSADWYPGLVSASAEMFEAQVRFLAKNYCIVSMDDVISEARGERMLPADAVQLTFDDATTDFAVNAWPVLKELGLPVTMFVPTAFPDNPRRHFWWDRLYRAVMRPDSGTTIPTASGSVKLTAGKQRTHVFRQLKEQLKKFRHARFESVLNEISTAAGVPDPAHNNVMGWDQLRKLHQEGVTLAPHTHTHPMLNQLALEQILTELLTSYETLGRKIESAVPRVLAYPAGGVSDDVVLAMKTAGFDVGFTTERGLNEDLSAPFRVKRINVGLRTTVGLLRLQLANWGK